MDPRPTPAVMVLEGFSNIDNHGKKVSTYGRYQTTAVFGNIESIGRYMLFSDSLWEQWHIYSGIFLLLGTCSGAVRV